jgi:hypothetical protein
MTILVDLVMFGWIPVVLLMFALMPTRRAVIAAFVIAWSFMPMAAYHIRGLPDYQKMSATCGGVLLAAAIFDIDKLLSFRPAWLDIPMSVWCFCPCVSSLTNGLGLYDGVSAAFAQTVTWGFPYFIGRLYLSDIGGIRELARGVLLGGMVYVPLCLYEIRMSPQLHRMFYGYHAFADFNQSMRGGGWRPTVFMDHGLMVAMWMCMAALVAIWAWRTGAIKQIIGIPMSVIAPVMFITAVLCKSTGALFLLLLGLFTLYTIKWWRTRFVIWVLIAAAPLYMALRITKTWDGSEILEISKLVSSERSQSMDFRLRNENLLVDKAVLQPVFGWGGWGRNQIITKDFRTVVDGQWIDAFGKYGLVGLGGFSAVLLLPAFLVAKRYPPQTWSSPIFAAGAGLLMINILYMLDNIPNAMVNPVYILAAGGLTGVLVNKRALVPSLQRRPAAAPPPAFNGPRVVTRISHSRMASP